MKTEVQVGTLAARRARARAVRPLREEVLRWLEALAPRPQQEWPGLPVREGWTRDSVGHLRPGQAVSPGQARVDPQERRVDPQERRVDLPERRVDLPAAARSVASPAVAEPLPGAGAPRA